MEDEQPMNERRASASAFPVSSMDNRRQYYRHALPPERGMSASFRSTDGASCLVGNLVNLSIGGLCVKFQEIPPKKKWIATFALGEEGATLTIPVEPVHARSEQPSQCGFRFLARPNPRVLEEQER